MNLKYISILFFMLVLLQVNGQSTNKEILFTVDDEAVTAAEFIRVYNKNLDLVQDPAQKDVDEYLKLFTNYKLKLKEARALGLDKKPSYLRELSNYKKQLASSYITDSQVTEALVEEAYNRVSYDVNATHILIKLPEEPTPDDTLVAYNDIVKIRERALKEGFETVRKEVHNGQTIYGEDLDWFSGFKMVYKFENAAYNTPVGEISEPFRTRFGYHIVYVKDKRKSRGERTVAHIMIFHKKEDTSGQESAERIQEIYKKLQQGETFETLAKQFSEDKSTAANGGRLEPISSGQVNSKVFEDTVFGLDEIGYFSEPIKTDYGWHIIKLLGKKPIASFNEMKPELEQRVKRDQRSKLIDEALYNKLKAKYKVTNEQPALTYFTGILNENYYRMSWELPVNFEGDKPLVRIGEKQLLFKDFGDFLVRNQRYNRTRESFKTIVEKGYNTFLNSQLVAYQEAHLEEEDVEFANIVSEYRDGLLLFDLMEETIWEAAKTDSLGVEDYYNAHKENYMAPEKVDAIVASSAKQKTMKKVSKLMAGGMSVENIKNLVNSNDNIDVIFTEEIMDAGHQALPENFQFKKGISKIYKHNDAFVVVDVKDIIPETQRTLEEAKGMVISDYQVYKEQKWVEALAAKYPVDVNQDVLQKVKTQLTK
ncbi:peptidylprolyl isomerase [Aestuariibaculum sediminum]|uniref:Peptidylprolyl isomerase n=1 Tax=Aestuariibaculum sediminum TaxID=2770637 RepID=A0A8J6QL58_9FLAO|nr:peptidylprolyl isomerase [Aestuariibaculum sediminum]MBD0833274.1 peptidylprolyl isomerase [Aestuariibaculum sediminum]